jgi:hypothetical protein
VKAPPPALAGVTVGPKEPTEPTGFGRETGVVTERSWGPVPEQKESVPRPVPRVPDGSGWHWAAA